MSDLPTFLHYTILVLYYLFIGVLGILSLFGIYILVTYGRTRLVVMAVSIVYIIALLSVIGASQITLHSL